VLEPLEMSDRAPRPVPNENSQLPPAPPKPRPDAAPYRIGLFVGACLSVLGLALAIAAESAIAPLILLTGWLVLAWSTHRMGRSGPLLDFSTSHFATRQSQHSDRD
jgi:hypothetical protein